MLKRIFNGLRGNHTVDVTSIPRENLPQHIAIIMDGNGRWAKQKGLIRTAGHHAGMKNVKKIVIAAHQLGIKVLTLYAFSTENWKRPKQEVDYLMSLPQEFFVQEIDELVRNNVRIIMMGYKEGLPQHAITPIEQAMERTKDNTGLILNIAINYGSRKEILHAVQQMIQDIQSGQLDPDDLSEDTFPRYLLSGDLPEPDLLIRTSGEYRISNFMLWQLAYSELCFVDVYWPDFNEQHFYEAIREYQRRVRRYGGI